jgi:hypothetical protein
MEMFNYNQKNLLSEVAAELPAESSQVVPQPVRLSTLREPFSPQSHSGV